MRIETKTLSKKVLENLTEWYRDNKNMDVPETLTQEVIWQRFLEWEGILGYERMLHEAHADIYMSKQLRERVRGYEEKQP